MSKGAVSPPNQKREVASRPFFAGLSIAFRSLFLYNEFVGIFTTVVDQAAE